jgi:glycosyltransferase involved in cell wall biosynthesis
MRVAEEAGGRDIGIGTSSGHPVPEAPGHRSRIRPTVMFHWQPTSFHGWGVYGLNLMLNWARRSDLSVCCSCPLDLSLLDLNPVERWAIDSILIESREANMRLRDLRGSVRVSCAVLLALGNNLSSGSPTQGLQLFGTPSIGFVFFEWNQFDGTLRQRASVFPLIVAGSTWNQEVLAGLGIDQVEVVLQGIDATHFHPAPKMGWLAGRFAVFSGGKLERRKGQDLVVQAFRVFAQRHRDALLVTAWSSPWPQLAQSLNVNSSVQPIPFSRDDQVDVAAWTRVNGIPEGQVLHLGRVPNAQMARILREMDVGLFPNRAEGGTNLVAMECMACGIPAILSSNTGHRDLIRTDNCYPLGRQGSIPDPGCEDWGESDVEEIVETLEAVYRNRAEAETRARHGAEMMAELTWTRQLNKLAEVIRPYLN